MNVSGRHWVYRLFDADGRLLYVGLTGNPEERIRGWVSSGKRVERYWWWADVVRVDWQQHDGRISAQVAERDAIRSEHPRHNVMMRIAS